MWQTGNNHTITGSSPCITQSYSDNTSGGSSTGDKFLDGNDGSWWYYNDKTQDYQPWIIVEPPVINTPALIPEPEPKSEPEPPEPVKPVPDIVKRLRKLEL